MEDKFLENNAASDIEKARFYAKFVLLVNWINTVWIRNRNQNFSKVGTGTGTATNHYSSTTLKPTSYLTTGPYIFANIIKLQKKRLNYCIRKCMYKYILINVKGCNL
jgi:hypothetical protein